MLDENEISDIISEIKDNDGVRNASLPDVMEAIVRFIFDSTFDVRIHVGGDKVQDSLQKLKNLIQQTLHRLDFTEKTSHAVTVNRKEYTIVPLTNHKLELETYLITICPHEMVKTVNMSILGNSVFMQNVFMQNSDMHITYLSDTEFTIEPKHVL